MTTSPANPSDSASAANARLWLQAACIFAAAVAFGVIYNSASPLGVRPQPVAVADGGSGTSGVVPAKPAVARQGFFNETLSMTLEVPPGRVTPPRGINPTPAGVAPQTQIPNLTWPQVQTLMAAQKVVVVDARTMAAFDLGHIPGAVLLPSNASVLVLKIATSICSSVTFGALYSAAIFDSVSPRFTE